MRTRALLRPRAMLLAVILGAGALTGCSTTDGSSAPSTGVTTPSGPVTGTAGCSSVLIQLRSGTLPAYRWSVTVDGNEGALDGEGGDQGSDTWHRSFVVDATAGSALCSYAVELAHGALTQRSGGATIYAEYTPDGGTRVFGPARVDASGTAERMATILPAAEWTALQQQVEAWESAPVTTAAPPTK